MREIARQLGRSPSMISRELRRNMRRHDRGKYDAVLAHARSREKAERARGGLIGRDVVLRDLVQDKLTQDWSLRTDQLLAPQNPPTEEVLACLPRNDLSSRLLAKKQRTNKEADHPPTHRQAAAQATSTTRGSHTTLHRARHFDRCEDRLNSPLKLLTLPGETKAHLSKGRRLSTTNLIPLTDQAIEWNCSN